MRAADGSRAGRWVVWRHALGAALPPLAAGVLVVAGGGHGGPDGQVAQLVELGQLGVQRAGLRLQLLSALAGQFVPLAVAPLQGGERPAGGVVAADVLLDHPAADADGPVVVAAARPGFAGYPASRLPGHRPVSESGAVARV
jgi:hypothetical protein